MKQRFGVLTFLCKVQVGIGILIIALAVIVPILTLVFGVFGPEDLNFRDDVAIIIAGTLGVFVGLSVIAVAQVYQCLMQIEMNTRPEVSTIQLSEAAHGIADNPLAMRAV